MRGAKRNLKWSGPTIIQGRNIISSSHLFGAYRKWKVYECAPRPFRSLVYSTIEFSIQILDFRFASNLALKESFTRFRLEHLNL